MSILCPTVLAGDAHAFREQMGKISSFAKRIQIDLSDGVFAPTRTVPLNKVWWPQGVSADIHLMYQRPDDFSEDLFSLNPNMVIFHYEADVDHIEFANELHNHNIKSGLSLLKDTAVSEVKNLLRYFDHLLIFSGDLGRFGGQADLTLLEKVAGIREAGVKIEIGWDGGINDNNISALSNAGVEVLNVGGFIQNANDPQEAYAILESRIN